MQGTTSEEEEDQDWRKIIHEADRGQLKVQGIGK